MCLSNRYARRTGRGGDGLVRLAKAPIKVRDHQSGELSVHQPSFNTWAIRAKRNPVRLQRLCADIEIHKVTLASIQRMEIRSGVLARNAPSMVRKR